jgi:hypothetical protein
MLLVAIIVDPTARVYSFEAPADRKEADWHSHSSNKFNAAPAASLCAGHAQQLGGESPLPNLMEVKG